MKAWTLVLLLSLLIVVGCAGNGRRPLVALPSVDTIKTEKIILPPPPNIDPATLDTLLPPDSIPAVNDPQFIPVAEAGNEAMAPNERIIGLQINGDTRAYPVNILSVHEIVNDVVGGEAIAVTWCPLCYSALVFSRQVDGQQAPLTFGVSGKLLQNTLVMFDRETDSLWSQLYGGAIEGQLRGAPLSVFPSVFTEWSTWAAQNPQGQLLSKSLTCGQFDCGTYATNPRGSYFVDPYASYYASADAGVINRQFPRGEGVVETKQRVVGVRLGEAARAYPYKTLNTVQVVNDEIEGVPVVVWFDPNTKTASAFRRDVDGRRLTFYPDPQNNFLMRDQETDTEWSGVEGVGVNGRLQNSRLPPLISTSAFEFGWYDYFPNSETYTYEAK